MVTDKTDMNVWARLIRVSQTLMNNVETDLKSGQLPPLTWYDVLLELSREKEGLRPFQLQDRLLIAQYNLSRLLDKLIDAGLIAKENCEKDGRGHVLKITASGEGLQKQMWVIYRKSVEDHFSVKLDQGSMGTLDEILIRLQKG